MAANYVEIKVKALDTARPDMTDLKARLAELGGTVETARVDVDDDEGRAKLLDINAKLAALNAKVANPKITVAGAARAEAQIAALGLAMDHLGDKSADEAGDRAGKGFMTRFAEWLRPSKFQFITAGIGAAMSLLPALGAVGGAGLVAALAVGVASKIPSVGKEIDGLGKTVMSTLESAVRPIVPVIRGMLSQVSGFVKSMGPELAQMFRAVAPAMMPMVQGFEQLVANILPGLVSLLHAAAPAVATFASLLSGLGKDVGGMFSAFAPAVAASSKVLAAIGTVLNGILPVVGGLAASFASSLGPVLLAFGNALHALAPAITLVGTILGKLAGAVLGSLTGALTAVAQVITGLAPTFGILARILGQVFSAMENTGVFGVLEDALEQLAGPVANLVSVLAAQLLPVLPKIIGLVVQFSAILSAGLARGLADLATGLAAIFKSMPFLAPLILAIVAGIKAWSIAQAILDVVLTANPIGLIIVAVAALIIVIVEVVKHWRDFAGAARAALGALKTAAVDTWHFVDNDLIHPLMAGISAVVSFIKAHWQILATILATMLLGPIAGVVVYVATHWQQIENLTSELVGDVRSVLSWFGRLPGLFLGWWNDAANAVNSGINRIVSFAASIPGRILAALADLGSMLFNAGAHAIAMLASGITSRIGDVEHAVHDAMSIVGDFIPHSPAKRGPLSGTGSPDRAGARIAQMLAQGMGGGTGAVSAAAARMAGAAGLGTARAPGLAAVGGALRVQLEWAGGNADSQLLQWIRKNVRIHGGGGPDSVQKAFGRTP